MTYFLDFDRTLFDTDAFIRHMFTRPLFAAFASAPDEKFKATLEERLVAGVLSFAPGELAEFLYPDSLDFIGSHAGCQILTRGRFLNFQKAKIASAFSGTIPIPVLYSLDANKGPFLAGTLLSEQQFTVADDEPIQLDSLREHFQNAAIYEMRRDGKEGCGRYPVVRSLSELL